MVVISSHTGNSFIDENYLKCGIILINLLKSLSYNLQEIADCFQVLAGILNVGNIKFATKDDSTELFVNTTDSIDNGKPLN